MLDRCGNKISIGSKVKLLRIDPKITEFLPEDESKEINSMLKNIVTVYDIRGQYICIERSWKKGKGRIITHRITVLSEDIELSS